MFKKSLFINCSEANRCCDQSQYKDASLYDKFRMLLHLSFCKPCRKYTANNGKLTSLIKESKLKTCSEEEKENWKNLIELEVNQ